MGDIETRKDIALLVHSFYDKVQKDTLIGPVFNTSIKEGDWDMHLNKMISFWSTVLLNEKNYRGNPFSHHISLSIDREHFDRWIELFYHTVDDNFEGAKAIEAKERAFKMRLMFETKLKYIRENPSQFPIM